MSEHFARGRSAEIFRTEDGKILKLFFPDYPREYAEKEYKNTKIAASLGCTGMQVYDVVERDGRFGFVMDCIDGVSQNDMPGKIRRIFSGRAKISPAAMSAYRRRAPESLTMCARSVSAFSARSAWRF